MSCPPPPADLSDRTKQRFAVMGTGCDLICLPRRPNILTLPLFSLHSQSDGLPLGTHHVGTQYQPKLNWSSLDLLHLAQTKISSATTNRCGSRSGAWRTNRRIPHSGTITYTASQPAATPTTKGFSTATMNTSSPSLVRCSSLNPS